MDGYDALARLEGEMQSLQEGFVLLDETYGQNTVQVTFVLGYLKKVLKNQRVVKFLGQRYADELAEFRRIAASGSLE